MSAKEENDIRPKKRKREWLLSLLKKPDINFKHQSIHCEKDDHSSIRNAPSSQVQHKCGHLRFIRLISDWVKIETLKRGKLTNSNSIIIIWIISHWIIINQCVLSQQQSLLCHYVSFFLYCYRFKDKHAFHC